MAHILLAEREHESAFAARSALRDAHHEVSVARTGSDAWQQLSRATFEIVLLSLELRDFRAAELLRRVRASSTLGPLPVIVRSEHTDEIDRILAFELGADDFVSAESSLRELALRVRAVLRRTRLGRQRRLREPAALETMEFRPRRRELVVGATLRRLTPIETRLLAVLLEQPDRVWQREELLRRVWAQPEVGRRTVDSQVRRLRHKMGDAAHLLETVRGVGYRLRIDRSSAQLPPGRHPTVTKRG